MMILREFKGYTLKSIMDTPFCHVIKLFQLAEKADALDSLSTYTGKAASYDRNILNALVEIRNSKIIKDKELYKKIATPMAKREAEKYGKSVN